MSDTVKIYGIEDVNDERLEQELEDGAYFVTFDYSISFLWTWRFESDFHYRRADQGTFFLGLKYTFISLLFGWWGPLGFIFVFLDLFRNFSGEDVTEEALELLGFFDEEEEEEVVEERRRRPATLRQPAYKRQDSRSSRSRRSKRSKASQDDYLDFSDYSARDNTPQLVQKSIEVGETPAPRRKGGRRYGRANSKKGLPFRGRSGKGQHY